MAMVFVIPAAIRLEQHMCMSKDEREAKWGGKGPEGEGRQGRVMGYMTIS